MRRQAFWFGGLLMVGIYGLTFRHTATSPFPDMWAVVGAIIGAIGCQCIYYAGRLSNA